MAINCGCNLTPEGLHSDIAQMMGHSVSIYSETRKGSGFWRNQSGVTERIADYVAYGARCSICGDLGGAYFTEDGAKRIAQEHNTVTLEFTRDQLAIVTEALRTAFLATRNPAFLALLNTEGFGE